MMRLLDSCCRFSCCYHTLLALIAFCSCTSNSFVVHPDLVFHFRPLPVLADFSTPHQFRRTARIWSTSKDNQYNQDAVSAIATQPFLEAANPRYKCDGLVGTGSFVISRTGEPTILELSNENILKIVQLESTDLEVNTLVWKCLGYRFDAQINEWTNLEVFPKWKENYPSPPDLIGMQRVYEREIDEPSLRSNQSLVRSVPVSAKQSLKTFLKPLGFSGYKYSELTPNKTRRAQCASWLLYYREELFGRSVEELQARRIDRQQNQQREKDDTQSIPEWKPPLREVF